MRKLCFLFLGLFIIHFFNSAQANTCKEYFAKKQVVSADVVLFEADSAGQANHSIRREIIIDAGKFIDRITDLRTIQLLESRRTFYQKMSGNSTRSRVDQMRRLRGDRFYRLLRSGDRVTALKMARQVFSPVIVAARVIDKANTLLEGLEARSKDSSLSKEELKENRKMIKALKKAIVEQSRNFKNYGDVRMIAWQLQRYLIKISQITASQQSMKEMSEGVANIFKEIERDAHERVGYIAHRVGSGNFETIFPELLDKWSAPRVSSKEGLVKLVWSHANYAKFIFEGKRTKTEDGLAAFGSHLPLKAVLRREARFEAMDAIKNVLGTLLRDIGGFFRSINSKRFESLIKDNSKLGWFAKRFNKMQRSYREVVYWLLKGLSEIESLERHAPKIDLVEDMLHRYKEKLETREDFVTTLMSLKGSFSGNEFFISFARIPEYRRTFRRTIEVVREEVESVKNEFQGRDLVAAKEQSLLEHLLEAEKIAARPEVGDLPLIYEPNLFSKITQYTFVYGGGTLAIYSGGKMAKAYIFKPEVIEALNQLLPGLF